jgi:hypothetical protein
MLENPGIKHQQRELSGEAIVPDDSELLRLSRRPTEYLLMTAAQHRG